MNQLRKHIYIYIYTFFFLENHYVSEDEVSIFTTHPPLETILITTKKDEVKASPFKIADDQTPIVSLIEQNNFTNQSLHIISQ